MTPKHYKLVEKLTDLFADTEADPEDILGALDEAWRAYCNDRLMVGVRQISRARSGASSITRITAIGGGG